MAHGPWLDIVLDIVRARSRSPSRGVYYRYICKVCHPTTPYSAHFRVAKPPPVAPEKGEARAWRASGLEVRSTPADAYRDKYRSDDVEALRRDLEATM